MKATANDTFKDRLNGTLLVLTAALLWGSSFAVRKMGMSEMGPLMQNTFRFAVAFCFIVVIILARKMKDKQSSDNAKLPLWMQIKYGMIIGAVYAFAALCQQMGLASVSAGTTGFITSLYTVLVPVISSIFFRDKIQKKIWYSIVLSFFGLYFVTSGGLALEVGMLILFLGSVLYAVQMILIGRYAKGADPFILVMIQLAMGVIINMAMAVILDEPFEFAMLRRSTFVIFFTGIFSLGVANLCQFIGQKKISPSAAAIVCSFESVFGMVFGIILLGESLVMSKAIGCILIFFAVIISQAEKGDAAEKRHLFKSFAEVLKCKRKRR